MERKDQPLGHQLDELSWYVIRSGRAVPSQSLYLSKHFLMSGVTETEGGMRVICKTIDQPVDVLAERRRRSSDTLSRRGEVPIKIVGVSAEWLLAWMERRCIVPHTSFGRFEENTVIIKYCLAFLIRLMSLFRVYLNMSHAPFLGERACASRRWFATLAGSEYSGSLTRARGVGHLCSLQQRSG